MTADTGYAMMYVHQPAIFINMSTLAYPIKGLEPVFINMGYIVFMAYGL